MVQGPQTAQPAAAGISQRLINPASPAQPELRSDAAKTARDGEATSSPARTQKSTPDSVVTAPSKAGKAGTIAHSQGLRAELILGETALQIAQEAFAAIEIIYAAMQELAEMARNENLTGSDRATLAAALQELKQGMEGIIQATVFDGNQILKGGDGPDGAFVITLSGLPLDILIPAVSLTDLLNGFEESDYFAVGSARFTKEGAEIAAREFHSQGHMIELQRARLQQIHATEIDSNQSLSDQVGSFRSPESAQQLSQSVAEIVLAGEDIPFEKSAERMRGVLERSHYDNRPEAAVTQNGTRRSRGDFVRSDEILRMPAPLIKSMDADMTRMSGLAEPASPELGSAPGDRTTLDDGYQAPKLHPDDAKPMTEPRGEKLVSGGDGQEFAVPAVRIGDPSPVLAGATIKTPDAQPPDRIVDRHISNSLQPVHTEMPGDLSVGRIAHSPHRVGVDPLPGMASAVEMGADLPENVPMDRVIAAALEPHQSRIQATAEVRLTELSKIAELDGSRRAAGLVLQVREADARLEAGLTVVKTTYEASTDQTQEFAASIPVEPGSLMAELLRADNMLHVADLSIEQIDLHLDYLGGLAEEAATESSRDRIALDEIFQAVKSNIIDNLAQTTEAQGEKILSGGGGRNGEYVIQLTVGGVAGEGHAIAIPSMRIKDLSPDLFYAHIRTRDAAMASIDHIEIAGADAAQARDMIAEQRTLIRQLISIEITQHASRPPPARSGLGF